MKSIFLTFNLFNYKDKEQIFVEILNAGVYKLDKRQEYIQNSEIILITTNLASLYYRYTKKENSEGFQYKSIYLDFQQNESNDFIQIIDNWDTECTKSFFHPISHPVNFGNDFFFSFLSTEKMNDSKMHHLPQIILNDSKYEIKKSKDHYEFNLHFSFDFGENFYFEVPELKIPKKILPCENIVCRFNSGIFIQRFASIYLPLISFKAIDFGCDVGTFSSIKKLVDFCNKCGIYQIILDIEKVNDEFIIDPIHYDCFFDANELITYDIDSIRKQKLKKLREELDSNIYTKDYKYFAVNYSKIYSKVDGIEHYERQRLLNAQYKCFSQLREAFLYACKKNVSISTVVINDEDVKNKVRFASSFSHSVYICNPYQKTINKDMYKEIDNYGLTIMIDSSIADAVKDDHLSFIVPHKQKTSDEACCTFLGPEALIPNSISEFPEEMSQRDIKHNIEERIYSDADVSILYLTDLLYITLPGAERSLYQPLRGKTDSNSDYWRYLYNFSVSDLIDDPNVVRKTKELLQNGNRYYEEIIDDD